ncbi:MAG: hypothetical protein ACPGJR_00325 [Akkermansiaceae bacterium]
MRRLDDSDRDPQLRLEQAGKVESNRREIGSRSSLRTEDDYVSMPMGAVSTCGYEISKFDVS